MVTKTTVAVTEGKAENENSLSPEFRKEYIKAKLYHLNGLESEIVTIMPFYTSWSTPYKEAAMQLKEYVYHLAKYWIKIEKFEIEFGRVLEDGTLRQGIKYPPYEIPMNMVFQEGKLGKWISLEDARADKFK